VTAASAPVEVLLVDDEPLIRWSLRRGLSQRGHHVVEAGTAAEALARLGAGPGPFDVVVLDYRLPDSQDLSLLQEIRRLAPSTVVLMMTAYGDEQMRSDALALGARIVIDKPFQVHAVVALVESPPPARATSNV
jgi:DNA-binding response OmpR family regulator